MKRPLTLGARVVLAVSWPLAVTAAWLYGLFLWPLAVLGDVEMTVDDGAPDTSGTDLAAELQARSDARDMLAARLQDLCDAVDDMAPLPDTPEGRILLDELTESREAVRHLAPEVARP